VLGHQIQDVIASNPEEACGVPLGNLSVAQQIENERFPRRSSMPSNESKAATRSPGSSIVIVRLAALVVVTVIYCSETMRRNHSQV
jgi:hypothetical protein